MNIFKKKMTLVTYVFPKLRTPKNVVGSMSKKSPFWEPFEKEDGKRAQTLLKFELQDIYHIFWSPWAQLCFTKSLLATCKILKLFIPILTDNDKYCVLTGHSLMKQIQMQLSQNEKPFSEFFSQGFKSSLNFEHFQKKKWPS